MVFAKRKEGDWSFNHLAQAAVRLAAALRVEHPQKYSSPLSQFLCTRTRFNSGYSLILLSSEIDPKLHILRGGL